MAVNAIRRVHAFFAAPVTLRRLALGSLIANVGIVITVWVFRDYWAGPAYEFMGLIAKAILIATQ